MNYLLIEDPGDGHSVTYGAEVEEDKIVLTYKGHAWTSLCRGKEAARMLDDGNLDNIIVKIGKRKIKFNLEELDLICLLMELRQGETKWVRTLEKYKLVE